MPTLDAATSHAANGATVAPEIIAYVQRYLAVETQRRESAIRALAATDRETDVRLVRIEAILTEQLAEQKRNTALTKSGRSASRTTAMIAGAGAATWIATHYDQLADAARFLGRFFR